MRMRFAPGEHAGGGVRGFARRRGALDDEDGEAALAKLDGEGESDDAGAADDYVVVGHGLILVGKVKTHHGGAEARRFVERKIKTYHRDTEDTEVHRGN